LYAASILFAEYEPKIWDDLKGQFMNHLDQVNQDLRAAGLPELGKK
jgi:homogentisate 1,2-dioxygenase